MDLRNFNGPQSLGEFDVIVIGDGTNDSFDDLTLEYDGNKLVGVTDDARADSYWGEIPQVPLYIH